MTDHGTEMYTPCPIWRVTYHCDRNVHTLPHQKGDRLLWYNAWIHLPHCDRDVHMFSSKGKYKYMWPWVTCRVTGLYDRCTHLAWPCRVWLVWQGCTYLAWPAGSQGSLTLGAAQHLHDPCHQLSDHWSSESCLQPAQATQQPHAQCSTSCTKSGNVQLPLVTSTEHFIILTTSSKAQILYIKKEALRVLQTWLCERGYACKKGKAKAQLQQRGEPTRSFPERMAGPSGLRLAMMMGTSPRGLPSPPATLIPSEPLKSCSSCTVLKWLASSLWPGHTDTKVTLQQCNTVLTLTWSHRRKGHITAV